MTDPPTRVLVLNHWHDDNRGDSAITTSTVRLIKDRYPGCSITVAGLLGERDRAYRAGFRHLIAAHPDLAVTGSMLPAVTTIADVTGSLSQTLTLALWALAQAPFMTVARTGRIPARLRRRLQGVDLVVLNGGSNLFDDPSMNGVLSAVRLFGILYPAACAQQLDIPVVGIGHTVSTLTRSFIRGPAGAVLARTAALSLRDDQSVEVCQALGAPAQRGHDAAFALIPRPSSRVDAVLARLPRPGGRTLAVSVRQHPTRGPVPTDAVNAEVAEAARRLLAREVIDQVLVVAHTVGPIAVEDDREVTARLARSLPADRTVHVEDDLAPDELSTLYGACSAMLAVRLHAAILAMVAGTPALAIAYFGTKTAGVMASAGLAESWLAYDGVGADDLAARVTDLMAGPAAETIADRLPSLRRSLRAQVGAWPDLRSSGGEDLDPGDLEGG